VPDVGGAPRGEDGVAGNRACRCRLRPSTSSTTSRRKVCGLSPRMEHEGVRHASREVKERGGDRAARRAFVESSAFGALRAGRCVGGEVVSCRGCGLAGGPPRRQAAGGTAVSNASVTGGRSCLRCQGERREQRGEKGRAGTGTSLSGRPAVDRAERHRSVLTFGGKVKPALHFTGGFGIVGRSRSTLKGTRGRGGRIAAAYSSSTTTSSYGGW